MTWQPINTAPKDGTEILISDYDAMDIVSWIEPRFNLTSGEWINREGEAMYPAWWQPLPDHPPLPAGEVELVEGLQEQVNYGICDVIGGDKLTRAADLLEQRHPAPVPEEAANPWKDALIDALVCNFLLTTENESDPKKALHDLISWETRLAMDPSINPLMRPVPVSERLPRPEDCDGERNCWQWIPDISGHYPLGHWELQHRDWVSDPDGDATHWLPATALPLPAGEVQP